MVLLTLTLGSRDHIHPESPLFQMITCCIIRFRRYSTIFSRDFVPVAFAIPYHRNILMDNYTHLPILHSIPLILLLPDALNGSPLFRESFELTALQFLVIWIPLRIIPLYYRRFFIPSCLSVSEKSLKSYSFLWKSSTAYCSWISCLLALWLIP